MAADFAFGQRPDWLVLTGH